MSWADRYEKSWGPLAQRQILDFENEVRAKVPNIQHGELEIAIEAISEQPEPPSIELVAENIRAIRNVGVTRKGKYLCDHCNDKGTLYFPYWYRISSFSLFDAQTTIMQIGHKISDFKKNKYPGMVFFEQRGFTPCLCEKGIRLMESWHGRNTSPLDRERLVSLAGIVTEWLEWYRKQPVEMVKNDIAKHFEKAATSVAFKMRTKPGRSRRSKPKLPKQRKSYADLLLEETAQQKPRDPRLPTTQHEIDQLYDW